MTETYDTREAALLRKKDLEQGREEKTVRMYPKYTPPCKTCGEGQKQQWIIEVEE